MRFGAPGIRVDGHRCRESTGFPGVRFGQWGSLPALKICILPRTQAAAETQDLPAVPEQEGEPQ
jgi:hypothetical protein